MSALSAQTGPSAVPRLRNILLLAIGGFLPAALYLYDLLTRGFVPGWANGDQHARNLFLMTQLTLLFLLLLCCAAAGEFFGTRGGCAGRINTAWLKKHGPWLLPIALVGGAISFFLYDVWLDRTVPGYYPHEFAPALLRVAKGAVAEEIVLRYGILSLFLAAFRRFEIANPLAATAAALVAARSFALLETPAEGLWIANIALSFFFSLAQGYVYRHGGLAACMLTRAAVSSKVLWFTVS